jgi:pseudaminic acid synthase
MKSLRVGGRTIGEGHPTYVVAEISGNHGQSYEVARQLVQSAIDAGADAVKLQTYTPDTITLRSDAPDFRVGEGSLWAGLTLWDLYEQAMTPWSWHAPLKDLVESAGCQFFSSPFDPSAVTFLTELGVPVWKVASFELVDLPLIEQMARTGLPMIMSTGMATLGEIEEAVNAARSAGAGGIALLKTNSAYPAPYEEMHLRTLPHLAEAFDCVVGLSDHSLGDSIAVAAVALGAHIIEKHICLDRALPGPDSAFSMEPSEFAAMVRSIRAVESALGRVTYGTTPSQAQSAAHRRSLYVVADVAEGQVLSPENVRSIRPGFGLHPRHLPEVLGRHAKRALSRGEAFTWSMIR